jgi:hypothetical protein
MKVVCLLLLPVCLAVSAAGCRTPYDYQRPPHPGETAGPETAHQSAEGRGTIVRPEDLDSKVQVDAVTSVTFSSSGGTTLHYKDGAQLTLRTQDEKSSTVQLEYTQGSQTSASTLEVDPAVYQQWFIGLLGRTQVPQGVSLKVQTGSDTVTIPQAH